MRSFASFPNELCSFYNPLKGIYILYVFAKEREKRKEKGTTKQVETIYAFLHEIYENTCFKCNCLIHLNNWEIKCKDTFFLILLISFSSYTLRIFCSSMTLQIQTKYFLIMKLNWGAINYNIIIFHVQLEKYDIIKLGKSYNKNFYDFRRHH